MVSMDISDINKRRGLSIKELIDTETEYVRDLKILVESFFDRINVAAWLPNDKKCDLIRNTSELHLFQHDFLSKLRESFSLSIPEFFENVIVDENESSSNVEYSKKDIMEDALIKKLGDIPLDDLTFDRIVYALSTVFLEYENHFQSIYSHYCALHDRALKTLGEFEKRPEMITALTGFRGSLSSRLDIKDYLIKPIQRLCRYQLLMKEIQKQYMKVEKEENVQKLEGKQNIEMALESMHRVTLAVDYTKLRVDIVEKTEAFFKSLYYNNLNSTTSHNNNGISTPVKTYFPSYFAQDSEVQDIDSGIINNKFIESNEMSSDSSILPKNIVVQNPPDNFYVFVEQEMYKDKDDTRINKALSNNDTKILTDKIKLSKRHMAISPVRRGSLDTVSLQGSKLHFSNRKTSISSMVSSEELNEGLPNVNELYSDTSNKDLDEIKESNDIPYKPQEFTFFNPLSDLNENILMDKGVYESLASCPSGRDEAGDIILNSGLYVISYEHNIKQEENKFNFLDNEENEQEILSFYQNNRIMMLNEIFTGAVENVTATSKLRYRAAFLFENYLFIVKPRKQNQYSLKFCVKLSEFELIIPPEKDLNSPSANIFHFINPKTGARFDFVTKNTSDLNQWCEALIALTSCQWGGLDNLLYPLSLDLQTSQQSSCSCTLLNHLQMSPQELEDFSSLDNSSWDHTFNKKDNEFEKLNLDDTFEDAVIMVNGKDINFESLGVKHDSAKFVSIKSKDSFKDKSDKSSTRSFIATPPILEQGLIEKVDDLNPVEKKYSDIDSVKYLEKQRDGSCLSNGSLGEGKYNQNEDYFSFIGPTQSFSKDEVSDHITFNTHRDSRNSNSNTMGSSIQVDNVSFQKYISVPNSTRSHSSLGIASNNDAMRMSAVFASKCTSVTVDESNKRNNSLKKKLSRKGWSSIGSIKNQPHYNDILLAPTPKSTQATYQFTKIMKKSTSNTNNNYHDRMKSTNKSHNHITNNNYFDSSSVSSGASNEGKQASNTKCHYKKEFSIGSSSPGSPSTFASSVYSRSTAESGSDYQYHQCENENLPLFVHFRRLQQLNILNRKFVHNRLRSKSTPDIRLYPVSCMIEEESATSSLQQHPMYSFDQLSLLSTNLSLKRSRKISFPPMNLRNVSPNKNIDKTHFNETNDKALFVLHNNVPLDSSKTKRDARNYYERHHGDKLNDSMRFNMSSKQISDINHPLNLRTRGEYKSYSKIPLSPEICDRNIQLNKSLPFKNNLNQQPTKSPATLSKLLRMRSQTIAQSGSKKNREENRDANRMQNKDNDNAKLFSRNTEKRASHNTNDTESCNIYVNNIDSISSVTKDGSGEGCWSLVESDSDINNTFISKVKTSISESPLKSHESSLYVNRKNSYSASDLLSFMKKKIRKSKKPTIWNVFSSLVDNNDNTNKKSDNLSEYKSDCISKTDGNKENEKLDSEINGKIGSPNYFVKASN